MADIENTVQPGEVGLANADAISPESVNMAETDDANNWLFQHELVLLVGILAASVVTMIAAARNCDEQEDDKCEKNDAFAVACGVVSLFVILFHIYTHRTNKELHNRCTPWVGGFLVPWWLCGVGSSTFKSPFTGTQNGYFAMWLGFSLSLYYCTLAVPKVGELFLLAEDRLGQKIEVKMMAALAAINSVVLIASLVECTSDSRSCDEEYGYAICVSVVSLFIALVYLPCHGRINDLSCGGFTLNKWLAYFLVIWWGCGAGVFTFDKPFVHTGNGWFACWGSFVLSVLLAAQVSGYGMFDAPAAPSDETPAEIQAPTSDGVPKVESAEI